MEIGRVYIVPPALADNNKWDDTQCLNYSSVNQDSLSVNLLYAINEDPIRSNTKFHFLLFVINNYIVDQTKYNFSEMTLLIVGMYPALIHDDIIRYLSTATR